VHENLLFHCLYVALCQISSIVTKENFCRCSPGRKFYSHSVYEWNMKSYAAPIWELCVFRKQLKNFSCSFKCKNLIDTWPNLPKMIRNWITISGNVKQKVNPKQSEEANAAIVAVVHSTERHFSLPHCVRDVIECGWKMWKPSSGLWAAEMKMDIVKI
jgi:hypothetical protein